MKQGRAIVFNGISSPGEAARDVLRIRFAECMQRQDAIFSDEREAMHAFRLACKRLRYALEREKNAAYDGAAQTLSRMADTLGEAHDCAALNARALKCEAPGIAERAAGDEARAVRRAQKIWTRAFRDGGGFEALARDTGFTW